MYMTYEMADQETYWLTHDLSHKMFGCKKSETEFTNYLRDNGSGKASESSYVFSNLQLQASYYIWVSNTAWFIKYSTALMVMCGCIWNIDRSTSGHTQTHGYKEFKNW